MGPSYNLPLKKILAGKGRWITVIVENFQRTELPFSYLAMLMGQTYSCHVEISKPAFSKILKLKLT
jgi:hypothetical protein